MTAKELRASILDLAIRGKLVPQDPNDEPAEKLLARIAAEKAKLVKSGKLKKEKPLPPITDDDKPFGLPRGWTWCRLGEIGHWGSGATPNKGVSEYFGGDIPWLLTGDLTDGHIKNIPNRITRRALAETSVKLNPAGSVLIAMYGATIGKLGILDVDATTNQACCACQVCDVVYNEFLFWFLFSQRDAFRKRGEGGAQPNISKEKIIETVFPFPPLAEQKRIVEKIEQLMPLVERYGQAEEKRRQLITALPEALKKSILKSAVEGKLVPQDPNDEPAEKLLARIAAEKAKLVKSGKLKKDKTESVIFRGADRLAYETRNGKTVCIEDELPFKIPDSWAWARLGSIVYNHGQKAPVSSFSYIDISSIDNRRQRLSDQETILTPKEASPRARKIVAQGDILYSCVRPYLHNACIIDKTFSREVIASTGFAVMATYDGVINKFLFLYLMSSHFDRYANDSDNAKGMAYPAISDKKLYEAIIPLPPLAEQIRIVAKIDEVMKLAKPLTK